MMRSENTGVSVLYGQHPGLVFFIPGHPGGAPYKITIDFDHYIPHPISTEMEDLLSAWIFSYS